MIVFAVRAMKTPAGSGSSNGGAAACGASFMQADEILVKAPDGALHRCVSFEGMQLTAIIGGGEHAVGQCDGDGYVCVLPSQIVSEARDGEAHRVHMVVDVEGERVPFLLLVDVVREEDARIVSVVKIT